MKNVLRIYRKRIEIEIIREDNKELIKEFYFLRKKIKRE